MPEDMSGRRIDDNLGELIERIGTGSFGDVYLAHHLYKKIDVAVKISRPELEERLKKEAESLKLVGSCPNTVSVEYVNFEAERPYIVMEFMEGDTLKDRLEKGTLDYEEAVRITINISKALQYAHEKGIIHRDVKPSNILFDKEGNAKLSDFGLYKILYDELKLSEELKNSMLSDGLSGKIVGTPNYMAPEQKENGEVSQESDIYSLGAVLFEMLTGKNIPKGRFDGPLDYNQNIPSDLNDIVNKMIASDKNKRYESAQQVMDDLENLVNPKPEKDQTPVIIVQPKPKEIPDVKPELQKTPHVGIEENGLVVAAGNEIFCVTPEEKILVERKYAGIVALCVHDERLYDVLGVIWTIYDTLSGKKIAARYTFTNALASHNGRLYDAASHIVYDTFKTSSDFPRIFKRKIAKRKSSIYALASHNGRLYDGGRYRAVYDTLAKKIVAKRDDWIRALVSHNSTLYDGGSQGYGSGAVFDTFADKIIAKRNDNVRALVSHNRRLYDATDKGIFDTLNDPEGKNPLWTFGDSHIFAMASAPMELWQELVNKGKSMDDFRKRMDSIKKRKTEYIKE